MIARAACAALVILAGALASSPAAAQPPEPIEPLPPPWLLPPPPAYRTTPMIFRDGAWQPFTSPDDLAPAPVGSAKDPLFPAGLTLGITGLVTSAIGVLWLASAGSSRPTCGLSGCLGLPDRETQNYGTGLIAGGVSAALVGGAAAYFGAKGPAPARVSNARMITGLAFTTVGVGILATGLMSAASPYSDPQSVPGQVSPPNYYPQRGYTTGVLTVFTVVSAGFLAIGLPLWITGARSPSRRGRRRAPTSQLDLLPSAGGASLRWTR